MARPPCPLPALALLLLLLKLLLLLALLLLLLLPLVLLPLVLLILKPLLLQSQHRQQHRLRLLPRSRVVCLLPSRRRWRRLILRTRSVWLGLTARSR